MNLRERLNRFWGNKDPKKLLADLETYINGINKNREYLRNKISELEAEMGIAQMKEEVAEVRRNSLHVLSKKEEAGAKKFREEHYASCKGNTRYILEGTGLGMAVDVQCTVCKKIEGITDSADW